MKSTFCAVMFLLAAQSFAADRNADVPLRLKLTTADAKDVLLSETGTVPIGGKWQFTHSSGPQVVDCTAIVRPGSDDSVVVEVNWTESDGKGQRVVWSPTVAIARGKQSIINVNWGKGVRTLTIGIDAPETVAAN